uniref:Uncharacterized protein n=1 Tax=Arundo donax TaxID=35708 RepID=A0A0A9BWH1_ARUDO
MSQHFPSNTHFLGHVGWSTASFQ